MKKLILGMIVQIMAMACLAQQMLPEESSYRTRFPSGPELNRWDSVFALGIPQKTLPEGLRSDELPSWVDNSALPYLRPVFEQQGPSCGQAAMVSYNFTYEMACDRDQPALFPQTQYPSHFTWNFQNGGNGWYGVSYFHSIEILRRCGCMNSWDYGGYYDDGRRWINGYDLYYNGMYNRVSGVYSIKTDSEDGILALKHWLYNHMGENLHGGVASFYANSPWNAEILAEGTPEAGKHVMAYWYPAATHAMTIIGYNDSIRYDYNDDGIYTNSVDLNGDGILDPRDWEIGAVKFVNSHGVGAQDSGFCYMMYKALSETFGQGGIWNREVHILEVDPDYQPMMTYKITLNHEKRKCIRIQAGVSQDTNDTAPACLMDFPILDYQGGDHFLQGHDTSEYLKSLEFGLDVTPLLHDLEAGLPARFFFTVEERDAYGEAEGEISAFSLMDYTDGQLEIPSAQAPADIENDSRTTVSLVHTPIFDKTRIITDTLPAFNPGMPYAFQLQAAGGTGPYSWEILRDYSMAMTEVEFPPVTGQPVLGGTSSDTLVPVPLGFHFPFYGLLYDTVWMHINGHLQMKNDQLSWPYMQEAALQFRRNRMIAPAEYERFVMISADNDGGWADIQDSCATFFWRLSHGSHPGNTEVLMASRLWPDGRIDLLYGPSEFEDAVWFGGISAGNNRDYCNSPLSGTRSLAHRKVSYHPAPFPENMQISAGGLLSGTCDSAGPIHDLSFRVTDQHGFTNRKTLQFTSGLYFYFTIHGGTDNQVDFGDTVRIDLALVNGSPFVLDGQDLQLFADDPYLQVIDGSASIGTLAPGATATLPAAFLMHVSVDVPDLRDIDLRITAQSDTLTWIKGLSLKVHAPMLNLKHYSIQSTDKILEPGETEPFRITIQNNGSTAIHDVTGTLISMNPEVQVLESPMQDYGTIGRSLSVSRDFLLFADSGTPEGFIARLVLNTLSAEGLLTSDTLRLRVGRAPALIIDMDPVNHSGPGIQAMMDELGVLSEYDYYINSDINNFQSLFICLGYQNYNHVLTLWEGQQLAEYLDAGGRIYMEGRKTWRDDPGTPVHPKFNITTGQVVGVYDTINGSSGTFASGLSLSNDATTPFSFYYLSPVDPAYTVLEDNNTQQSCAVAYDAGNYRTVAALFEYGTMSDISPQACRNLLKAYLEFFGVPVNPVMAEAHGDMGDELILRPNPAYDQVTIDFPGSAYHRQRPGYRLSLSDVSGSIHLQADHIDHFPYRMDISKLKPGLYLVKIIDDNGIFFTKKLVKISK